MGIDPDVILQGLPSGVDCPSRVTADLRIEAAMLAVATVSVLDLERSPIADGEFTRDSYGLLIECIEECVISLAKIADALPADRYESFIREAFTSKSLLTFAAKSIVHLEWEPGVRIASEITAVDGNPTVPDDGSARSS